MPKRVATDSQLSDLASDLKSYLVVMSGVQSDVYSLLSDHHSDFQSRVPKAVATNSQLSDLASDLKSYLAGISDVLSDLQSDFQSRVPKLVATDSALSDARSDIKSAIANITVTIGASDISDIASAVVAGLPVTSQISDILSMLSDFFSDFQSRVPKRVATDSQLSDVASDLKSYLAGLSSTQSDIYSLLSDHHSDFQSRVPKLVATNSQLSDLASDLRSVAILNQSAISDIYSLLSDVSSDLGVMSGIQSDIYSALTTARAEPAQGAPAATATPLSKLDFIYKATRNKVTQTASRFVIYADDATTKDHSTVVSDDGTTFTRGEIGTGI